MSNSGKAARDVALLELELKAISVPASLRERELEAGSLVIRAATDGHPFLARRAWAAVAGLESGVPRKALRRVLQGVADAEPGAIASGLLAYGGVLEGHGVLDRAGEAYGAVASARPWDACALLHVARIARKSGRREAALELYRRAAAQSASGHIVLLARVGEALVSERPLEALSAVVREARRQGDMDALAVAREERARLWLAARRTPAAVRDLTAAAARYTDRTDRIRVLHRLADVLSAQGDLSAAREVLLAAQEHADSARRDHTVQRLRTVARAMGDVLELRRSRGQGRAGLVMLAPARSRQRTSATSLAPRFRRWRTLLPTL